MALFAFDKFTRMNASVVLVTGASAGIGQACVKRFLELGAFVIGWSRRPTTAPAGYEEKFFHQVVDVRDRNNVHRAYTDLVTHLSTRKPQASQQDGIDVLVNNAGLSRGLGSVHEGNSEDWVEMIDTNIKGLLWVTQVVSANMVARGRGTIVNIASVAGRQPYRGGNVYGATKAAVKMLSDSMQLDFNGTGVRVCNIDPGMVETEFSLVRYRGDSERAKKVYTGLQPLSADDVADTVVYAATRPQHVTLQDILLMPTDQASVNLVNRKP